MPQNVHDWLMKQPPHQVRNMLLHPPKVAKVKEISAKGQKAAPNLVVNQNATKHALLADETATTSGEEHVALPPKVSKVKEISAKGQKAAPNLLLNKGSYPKRHQHCVMKEPWHPLVIWMEKTIIFLKMTIRVLLLNMSLV